MTKDLKGDRWTCPNDRNLHLRSKLNAGWSCHTGKKTMRKDPQLSENELIEIQKVIQRSQMLEQKEKERVMRMMDRLENMKRNANQSTSNNSASNKCALCGDYFYLLRSMPNQCSSCRKILCTKCCIDTPYNNDSNVSSRRNSFATQPQSGPGNENRSVVYLCRLCSEQREFLKKSGVWFLKRLPTYIDNKEKFSSTSNLSSDTITADEAVKPHSANQSRAFVIPSFVRRNLSSSPSSSSNAFKFWKTSIGGSQQAAQSVEFDSLSCYSNDTEPPHSNSNSSDATTTVMTNTTAGAMAAATSPPSASGFMHNISISEQMSSSMAARSPSILTTNQASFTGEIHKLSTSNTPSANASPSSFSKIFEFFPKSGTQSLLSTTDSVSGATAPQPSSPNPATAYSSQQLLNTSIRRFNQFFKRNTSGSTSHEDEPPYDARSVETSTSSNPNNNNNNNNGSTAAAASILATQTTSTSLQQPTTANLTTTTAVSQQVVNSSFDNDLANSPNMSSYRYYSNIMSNLSDSKMNLNQLNDNASLNSTNSSSLSSNNNNNRKNSTNESDDLLKRAFRPNHISSLSTDSKTENSNNDENNKHISSNHEVGSAASMSGGGEASTSSTSNSTRQHEAKFAHSTVLRMRSEVLPRKAYKTSTEWCGSQLSLDDENVDEPMRTGTAKTSRSSSKNTINQIGNMSNTNLSSLVGSVSSVRPRISSQAVNNLAKRIVSQNSSMMIGSATASAANTKSVAASSSSVIASASSLASSLNKLNFNN